MEPRRLFVAGLHNDEWKDTSDLLEGLGEPKSGCLILIPIVDDGPYMSTLDPRYYEGPGQAILDAIERFHPNTYLELHSYQPENKDRLTNMERLKREGVPPYIELEEGILIGSVSPGLRRTKFTPDDLCVSLEIPRGNQRAREIIARLLDEIKDVDGRDDFLELMMSRYPEPTRLAVKNYERFFGLH